MRRIRTTYETVSPDSAADGECEDRGWIDRRGECIVPDDYDLDEYGSEFDAVVALAVKAIGRGCEPSTSPTCSPGRTWYTDADGSIDYSNGFDTRNSYHLSGFTENEELAIYAEITRR
jgi:hypothetical protein